MANQGKGNLLIIFGKYPEAGQVKTRLAKSIGDSNAAEAMSVVKKDYRSFLEESLEL